MLNRQGHVSDRVLERCRRFRDAITAVPRVACDGQSPIHEYASLIPEHLQNMIATVGCVDITLILSIAGQFWPERRSPCSPECAEDSHPDHLHLRIVKSARICAGSDSSTSGGAARLT